MADSPLSNSAILGRMADALPSHPPNDDSSDLASSYEAVALLIHAYMTAIGFKLQGFDEEKPLPECESLAPRLPSQWNTGFGSLSFAYSHKQSAMKFVIRVDRMGGKVEIRGLAVGDERIYRFERVVRDVVKSSALPVRITVTESGEDRSDLTDKLRDVFVSEEAISSILHDLKVHIIQKLIPKLQSKGYEETAEAETATDEARRTVRAYHDLDPRNNRPIFDTQIPEFARPRPAQPVGDFAPPGFEDPYEMNRPGVVHPLLGRSPYNIGHDDLNPPGLGPQDPLRGSFIGGGLPRPGGGSGMHPTFDDPLFRGPGGQGGQGGFDPQAPPGARWDPLGPGDNPRFPGPGSGRGNNPFGGFGGGDII